MCFRRRRAGEGVEESGGEADGGFDLKRIGRNGIDDFFPFFPPTSTAGNMSQQALNKIAPNSPSRAKPNEVETNVATALYELETNVPDMRGALRPLQFMSAREV
ncbi:hypothetical protein KC335_g19112 [Hortaea werneckii]|nr:hypothetical protein KC335_g19112 [Hortaea werneckii]